MITRAHGRLPVLLAITLALAASAPAAPAQSVAALKPWKWSKQKLDLGFSSAITIDAQGYPRVAFQAELPDGSNAIRIARNDSKHWAIEEIYADNQLGGPVGVVVGGDGVTHVVFVARPGQGEPYFLHYAHDDGGSWRIEALEPGGPGASIGLDPQGVPHITHIHSEIGTSVTSTLRHLELTPGGWVGETLASDDDYFYGTALQLGDGLVRVLYSDSATPRAVHMATREDGVWSVEDVDEGFAGETTLAVEPDGTVHVAYVTAQSGDMRHAWRTDEGWQHETLVTQDSLFGEAVPQGLDVYGREPALAGDAAGRVHLVFELGVYAGNGSGKTLVAATLEEGLWVPKAAGPGQAGHDPGIAVAPGGIVHVSTGKDLNENDIGLLALQMKGRKLKLAVAPQGAGVITDTLTGRTCDSKLVESFYPGTEVELTMEPAPGFAFVGWFAHGTGTDASTSVTLDKNRRVIARFEALPER